MGWTEQTFKPKYDMVPSNAYMMFRNAALPIDLVEHLNSLGVKLDFSKSENTQYLFQGAKFTRIGVVDLSSSLNSYPADAMFIGNTALVTIDKLVLKTGAYGECNTAAFMNCTALKNLTVEGTFTTEVNLQWSPLTVDSMKSVISCLKNYVGTDKELKYQLTFNEDCWDALETSGPSPSGYSWKAYLELDLGWLT